jgi:dTDP-4-dehydrorhamnose reductase
MSNKIIVTGGDGRFAKALRQTKNKYNFIFRNKNQLNIMSLASIKNNIRKFKPNTILHLAGLSRPMSIHDRDINKSIDLNIIGTANLVKACSESKLKLIFFSSSYIYPGKKGNYKEEEPLLPWNNYGWSKLGAESSVQMYKNSLIIRACMTEKPFVHKSAFTNVKTNFIFHHELAKLFVKLIKFKGIINLGGKQQSIYQFTKQNNISVKKIKSKGELPLKMDMNLKKYKRLIKNEDY